MSLDKPILLLTLLIVPAAIALFVLAERRRMRYAIAFTNIDVLASVARRGSRWRRYVPPALFLLALALLCFSLTRPHRNTLVASERATVILVVDVSGSMQAKDVKPTRLGAAQAAVRTFLDRVPKQVRIGLVAFSSEPYVATSPTTDRQLVRTAVDELGFFPGYGGTAIGDALAAAVELGRRAVPGTAETIAYTTAASKPNSPVSILFLSDGKQTRGELEPLDGAQKAKDAGIPVYTVALGTPTGTITRNSQFFGGRRVIPVPPDPITLSAVARLTGGKFLAARTAEALESAYADLGSRLGRVPGRTEVTYAFLAVAAVLLLGAAVLSALWAPRIP